MVEMYHTPASVLAKWREEGVSMKAIEEREKSMCAARKAAQVCCHDPGLKYRLPDVFACLMSLLFFLSAVIDTSAVVVASAARCHDNADLGMAGLRSLRGGTRSSLSAR